MKIAAFNVQKLGWKKVNNPAVRRNLIKIVSRYSVVVLLEVVDQSGKAMVKFLTELNKTRRNRQCPYAMKCSESLGRSSYKEKFVFFYREDEISVIDSYQYREEDDDEEEEDEYEDEEGEEEEEEDEFEDEEGEEEEEEEEEDKDVLAREPFILLLDWPDSVVQRLALIPVHTKPEDAERELDALHDVVEDVRKKCGTDNIMILGDMNADGRYLSKKKKEKISICFPPYHWLINDDVDTTTSDSTDHTYDRIVVFGEKMYKAVVPNSAQAFNFQRACGLSDASTQAISDHYPVEVELKKKNIRQTSP